MDGIWYATREQVSSSLEIMNSARAKAIIDAKLDAASRSVEGQLHRRFYPEQKTVFFDWPNYQYANTWQLRLGDNEIISLTELSAGGTTISASDYFLRRDDDKDEPPYSLIEIDLASTAAFRSGVTPQRAISATGLFGYNATNTSVPPHGSLGGDINSSVTTLVINPLSGVFEVGCGSIVIIGTERLIIVNRRMSDTGQNLQSNMAALQSDSVVDVSDGTLFAEGEVILLDAERMRIDFIAGNNLVCTRAFDGTNLTSHTASADVYASRTFLAQRGALGSTAASHTSADAVYVHQMPGLVNELCIAEAVVLLEQNSAGYARVVGGGNSARESAGKGLEDVRAQAWQKYGRKNRSTAI